MKATEDVVLRVGLELFGARGLSVLLVWSFALVAMAPLGAGRAWTLAHGPLSVSTRYRRVAELDRLREALAAEGYDVSTAHSGIGEAMWRVAA
jgi:hypothetical protein